MTNGRSTRVSMLLAPPGNERARLGDSHVMKVVDWRVAAADDITRRERAGQVVLRGGDGFDRIKSSRQIGGDCRRKRAAGAVGVFSVHALDRELMKFFAVEYDIDRLAAAMPALDYHKPWAKLRNRAGRIPGVLVAADLTLGKDFCLWNIGSDHQGERQKLCSEGANGVRLE